MIQFSQNRLDEIISGFSDKRIMVIGDLMIDEYLIGDVSRISPEAPVPVVEISEQTKRLGGAANVALNLSTLGCIPIMVGIIGDDIIGNQLLELLKKRTVLDHGVVCLKNRPTTVKTRIIGDAQHIARVDREINNCLKSEDEERLIIKINEILPSIDGIILQDYNKGVLTENIIAYITAEAKKNNKLITVDPKFRNFLNYQNVTVFKPNIKETEQALAIRISNEQDLLSAGNTLQEKLQAESVLITRGSDGMTLFEGKNRVTHVSTKARKVADVSGAGDTVISTLTASLTGGASIQEAATIANYAAGIVCEEVGIVPIENQKLYKACLGKDI